MTRDGVGVGPYPSFGAGTITYEGRAKSGRFSAVKPNMGCLPKDYRTSMGKKWLIWMSYDDGKGASWIINKHGCIIDSPPTMRGYWEGKQVAVPTILSRGVIVLRDLVTGDLEEIFCDALEIHETSLERLPDSDHYACETRYDIAEKRGDL